MTSIISTIFIFRLINTNAQQASTFAVIYFLLFICEGQPQLYFFYSLVRFAQLAYLFLNFAFSFRLYFMTFTALEIHDHDQRTGKRYSKCFAVL